MSHSELQKLGLTLEKVLARHGYGLQYAAIKAAEETFEKCRSWVFEVAELPVKVREGCESRIDFVLSRLCRLRDARPDYLVVECKRANPALRNWWFIRAPYIRRGRDREQFFVEKVVIDLSKLLTAAPRRTVGATGGVLDFRINEEAYHIALEIRSGEKGDPRGPGRGAIEEACGQVCKGVSGLVELIASQPDLFVGDIRQDAGGDEMASLRIIPVVVTTARLLTTETDLSGASLSDGVLPQGKTEVKERPWVFYQYHRSQSLRHSWFIKKDSGRLATQLPGYGRRRILNYTLGELLDQEYVRTIPIVNAESFGRFLERFRWW